MIEVRVNRPGEVILEKRGKGKVFQHDKGVKTGVVKDMMSAIANHHRMRFDENEQPLVAASLPGGHRFQGLVGPSVPGGISITVRCKHKFRVKYSDFGLEGEALALLRGAVKAERTVILSGSTNSGKTTLMNLLLKDVDAGRRVITVEDTAELETERFPDCVRVLVAREKVAAAPGVISYRQAYDHLMRSTPEIAVFGEISTTNAFAALGLLNSGHRGFMTTIHAESPEEVVERKFSQQVEWAGERMSNIPEYLRGMVDMVVQVHKTKKGNREVAALYLPKSGKYLFRKEVDTLLDFEDALRAAMEREGAA
ncbi:ATPase, T2SS/T4P/T4SS family [Magnetospira sp. QH-2]|uniref:ATPase, T2SS/T4P/T4SS family n=1 Tax=Magnetospira sp. (strain QH-2) TaxID=1288970 RepID=UPI000696F7A6|nr:ATPase, T2SS/T4P/T4SS family [Magnetospira sp. QH-2]